MVKVASRGAGTRLIDVSREIRRARQSIVVELEVEWLSLRLDGGVRDQDVVTSRGKDPNLSGIAREGEIAGVERPQWDAIGLGAAGWKPTAAAEGHEETRRVD